MLTHEQALIEAKELWKYMAITGETDKTKAVCLLHEKRLLSQDSYRHDCPFCELYYNSYCTGCPFPGNKRLRCYETTYADWEKHFYYGINDSNESKIAASKVYQLIKTFK